MICLGLFYFYIDTLLLILFCGFRLHLTITALNEILKTLLKCSSDETLEDYDKEYLVGLQS